MRKILVSILLSLSVASAALPAQPFGFFGFGNERSPKEKALKFVYGAEFKYYFDNREFDTGKNLYTGSMTINAARLTPSAGIAINENEKIRHRAVLGIDVLKNMGESPVSASDKALENRGLLREMLLYYKLQAEAGKSKIGGYAGVFPRSLARGGYGNEFLSDSLRFYDNNIEGILIQILRPKASYELGCDWLGMFGRGRRERFIIFSQGEASLMSWLSCGWYFSGYHLANMVEYGGVVDHFLAKPFIKIHLEPLVPLQNFSLSFSWLQGAQRDRSINTGFDFPAGGQVELRLMHRGIGIENKLFIGTSLMPYYNNLDPGGNKYGSLLYRGDPFYRISAKNPDLRQIGLYNRLEVFYQPRISDFMDLKLSCLLHFAEKEEGNTGFIGSRQKFSLIFNIEKLTRPEKKAGPKSLRKRKTERGSISGKEYYM